MRRQPFRLPEDAAMSRRLSLAVLLLSSAFACHAVHAREVALQGPNGDGGACVVSRADVAGTVDRSDATDPAPAKPTAKPAATRQAGGGGGGSSVRNTQAPRWHSFLPGMFR
jgi:hypothetical protein